MHNSRRLQLEQATLKDETLKAFCSGRLVKFTMRRAQGLPGWGNDHILTWLNMCAIVHSRIDVYQGETSSRCA